MGQNGTKPWQDRDKTEENKTGHIGQEKKEKDKLRQDKEKKEGKGKKEGKTKPSTQNCTYLMK